MITDEQKEVIDVLRTAKQPLTSREIYNACQVSTQKQVSLALSELVDIGSVIKNDDRTYQLFGKNIIGSPKPVKANAKKDLPMVLPKELDSQLSALEQALTPFPLTATPMETKLAVLARLSLILDPSISAVLDDIAQDLSAINETVINVEAA